MPAKTAHRLEADRLVKAMPQALTRTLAKRISKEYGVTIEQARSAVRTARGANGKDHVHRATVTRKKGTAGTVPEMPPSLAEPWLPYQLEAKRIAILSDIHVPYHSEVAVMAAIDEVKKFQPDAILLNGDTCDFYSISRWQKSPKKRDFRKELGLCRDLLKWIRAQFPKVQIVFKMGNHEERWDHYLWNYAPEISDDPRMSLENWLDMEEVGITLIGNQRPIMCGKLPVLHGHELGKSIFSPVNPARGAFLRAHHTVLVGHSHQTSSHADTDMFHKETFIWSAGCLCDLTPEYARVNRWNWGFALLEVAADGSFEVRNKRVSHAGVVRSS